MKPILFNGEMVRALLEGRKTVTRRLVKPPALYAIVEDEKGNCVGSWYEDEHGGYEYPTVADCPYLPGDILYVRETWAEMPYGYVYRADGAEPEGWDHDDHWRPSIHMPRKAARIFLRVTDVRVERLQDITEVDVIAEGAEPLIVCKNEHAIPTAYGGEMCWNYNPCKDCPAFKTWAESFGEKVWNSTIKPADRARYGWQANPWVWVIEFERISKEEPEKQGPSPASKSDPIGALGPVEICPICRDVEVSWNPNSDVSTCPSCGWNNAEAAKANRRKRIERGE